MRIIRMQLFLVLLSECLFACKPTSTAKSDIKYVESGNMFGLANKRYLYLVKMGQILADQYGCLYVYEGKRGEVADDKAKILSAIRVGPRLFNWSYLVSRVSEHVKTPVIKDLPFLEGSSYAAVNKLILELENDVDGANINERNNTEDARGNAVNALIKLISSESNTGSIETGDLMCPQKHPLALIQEQPSVASNPEVEIAGICIDKASGETVRDYTISAYDIRKASFCFSHIGKALNSADSLTLIETKKGRHP